MTDEPKIIDAKYTIKGKLGGGGFSEVYLVEGPDGESALKLLHEVSGSAQASALDEFKNEFSILKNLNHPHIARILDFGYDDAIGRYYYTTELIEGRPIFEVTEDLSIEEVTDLIVQALRALAYLHSFRINHFDIKSANILVVPNSPSTVKIIDFGLAGIDPRGRLIGTPSYMSPEVINREPADSRADLYSLAVLWYFCLARSNPFRSGKARETMQNQVRMMPPPPSSFRKEIPAWLDEIILRLLQKNPAKRFAQAMRVVRELNRFSEKKYPIETLETLASYLPQEGDLVGRVQEMETIRVALGTLEAGEVRCVSVVIQGARGCGKTRFVRELKYEAQLKEFRVSMGNAVLGEEYSVWREALLHHVNKGSGVGVFILDNVDFLSGDNAAVQELMQLISRAQRPTSDSSAMIVFTTSSTSDDQFVSSLASLAPLSIALHNFSAGDMTAYLASLTGLEEPPVDLVDEILSRTDGNPLFVTEILKALIAGGGLFDRGGRWKATVFEDVGIDYSKATMPETIEEMLLSSITHFGADEQLLLKALAVANAPSLAANLARYTAIEDSFAHLRSLVQEDFLERDEQHFYRFVNDLLRQALYTSMSDEERVKLHDRIAKTLEAEGAPFEETAHHVSLGSDAQRASDAAKQLGERYLKRGLGKKAAEYLERAATMVPDKDLEARVDILLKQGEALLISRNYPKAEELFGCVEQLLARISDGERAVKRQIETLVRLGGTYMKMSAFSRARAAFTEAKVKLGMQSPDPVREAHVENFLGSVLMHEGRYREAQKVFERTRESWRALSSEDRAQVTNNDLGMVCLALKNLAGAREAFVEDKAFADEIGHDLLIALAQYNLAQLAVAEGKPDDAIAGYKECVEVCKRSSNTELLLRAYNGLGTIYHLRGELDESIAYYERGLALHERAGDARGGAAISVNIGIIQNSRGKFSEALDALIPAVEFLRGLHDKTAADWTALSRGLLELGDVYKNQGELGKAEERLRSAHEVSVVHESAAGNRFWILLTLAEVARDKGETEQMGALIAQLRPLASTDDERKLVEEMAGELSGGAVSISKAVRSVTGSSSRKTEIKPSPQKSSYEKVLEINKLINADRDLDYVLKTVIYYALELAGAESGAIVLVDDDGEMSVACQRNMDGREDEVAFSTTLARRVLADGAPVTTDNALDDERFANEQSIAAHGLKSIMCHPIRAKGRVVGVMYLDHRFSIGAFADVDMKLIDAFTDQVGLAIDNARLVSQLAKRKDDLSAELSAASVRIERYEEMLKERGGFEPEKDYGVFATGSRAMREAINILDRVADTEISILIVGESGVGKELIARALHSNNTQRKNARFIAINCAAIPATLLESELFGYKAGAFTGAQRDKRGLIEAAEGGTLFFDEIAELDISLQVKLLRVLQEREFIPVGDTKSRSCDVRVIAATNRDIDQEVKRGAFRDDLFYRLCQVKVVIPPLRDRPEDVPQLAKQFVNDIAEGRDIAFDSALVKRMLEYPWPGNVRELQNLVRVACTLVEGNVITDAAIPATSPFAQYRWGGRAVRTREARSKEQGASPEEAKDLITIDEHNAYDPGKAWQDYEILIIAKAYQANGFRASRTAAELGISTATLYKRIKEWKLKDVNNDLYRDSFRYTKETKLDEYVPRVFGAALASADGRATQAIANLQVSQGYFYKVMKRASVPKDIGI